jgi:hypothetical protein
MHSDVICTEVRSHAVAYAILFTQKRSVICQKGIVYVPLTCLKHMGK